MRGQAWQLFFIFFVTPELGFALEGTDRSAHVENKPEILLGEEKKTLNIYFFTEISKPKSMPRKFRFWLNSKKWCHLIYPEAAKLSVTGMCVSKFIVELLKLLVTKVLV